MNMHKLTTDVLLKEKSVRLPFPCFTLLGLELLSEQYPEIFPEQRYQERWDPLPILHKLDTLDLSKVMTRDVCFPKQVMRFKSVRKQAAEITDALTSTALVLLTELQNFKDTEFGRGAVQKALLRYQGQLLFNLKSVLRDKVFKQTFPGCYAPLVPDPTLKFWQVRVPVGSWSLFSGKLALALRHPVLEKIYVLEPVRGNTQTIQLHPLLFPTIGADADGDCMLLSPIPTWVGQDRLNFALTASEAMVLQAALPSGRAQRMPVQLPPLSLENIDGFLQAISTKIPQSSVDQTNGLVVRNVKNVLLKPMDNKTYHQEALKAAGRFFTEKMSIGLADSVRRKLLALANEDSLLLRAINTFCGTATQKAIDAGKHRITFPLNEYVAAFSGNMLDSNGRWIPITRAEEMASLLCFIVDGETGKSYDLAFRIAKFMFSFEDFPTLGLNQIMAKVCPLFAMSSIKGYHYPTNMNMPFDEAACLINLLQATNHDLNILKPTPVK